MKTFVLSTLISVAAVGSSFADTPNEPVNNKASISALKETAAFHRNNIDVLYNQYDLAETRLKASRGNHAELERDRRYFIGLFQQDIDNGIRVEQSKEAIAEIEDRYAKLHAERDAYEAREIARLKKLLDTAVKKEEKEVAKANKALSKAAVAAR